MKASVQKMIATGLLGAASLTVSGKVSPPTDKEIFNALNTTRTEVGINGAQSGFASEFGATIMPNSDESASTSDNTPGPDMEGGKTNAERTWQYAKDLGISIDNKWNEYIGARLRILDDVSYGHLLGLVQIWFEGVSDEMKSPFAMFVVENTYNLWKERGWEKENFEFEIESAYDDLGKYLEACEQVAQGVVGCVEQQKDIQASRERLIALKATNAKLKDAREESRNMASWSIKTAYENYKQGKGTKQALIDKLQADWDWSKWLNAWVGVRDADALAIFAEFWIK